MTNTNLTKGTIAETVQPEVIVSDNTGFDLNEWAKKNKIFCDYVVLEAVADCSAHYEEQIKKSNEQMRIISNENLRLMVNCSELFTDNVKLKEQISKEKKLYALLADDYIDSSKKLEERSIEIDKLKELLRQTLPFLNKLEVYASTWGVSAKEKETELYKQIQEAVK